MIQRENGLPNETKEVTFRVSENDLDSVIGEIMNIIWDMKTSRYFLVECHKLKGKGFEYIIKFKSNEKGLK